MVLASRLPRFLRPLLQAGRRALGGFPEDAYDSFRERFGRDTLILVAIRPPEVFELGFLEKLRAFHSDVEREVPMLVEVPGRNWMKSGGMAWRSRRCFGVRWVSRSPSKRTCSR